VDDVLITGELARRPSRPPDYAAENEALVALTRELTADPAGVLRKVAELVVRLCRADSAGVSVLEREGGEEIFRWHAAAGQFAPNLGGAMPSAASPCGAVITRGVVLLFKEAERFFPAMRDYEPRIYENLLAPREAGGKLTGTVWAIGHSPGHGFDAEDARLLASLARFAGAAYGFLEHARAAEGFRAERLAALNLMEDAVIARREAEQAGAALRQSEERYRTLFNSMDEGYILVDVLFDEDDKPVDILYREANQAALRMTGTELVGRRAREFAPDTEPHWFETFGRVAKTGVGERHEFQFAPLGAWYDFYVFKAGAAGGPGVAAVYKDVTERRRAEESQRRAAELDAFRVALADALRPLTDPLEIQRAATRVVGERLAADCVRYAEIADDGETITVADNYLRGDFPKITGRFPVSDFGTVTDILRTGRNFITRDARRDERFSVAEREALLALHNVSFLAIPLVKNNRWVSNLAAYHGEPHEWTEDEIRLLEETAERTWAAVERAHAEEALRQSKGRMQRVLETEAVGVIFFDHAGTVVDANHAFLEMTGYTRDEIERRELTWRVLTPPGWVRETEGQLEKMAATGRIGPYEKEYVLKDGSHKWMLFAGRDLGDGTISEYCIDITGRKRAEEALRASEERLRLVVESVEDYAIFTTDTEGRINSWNPGAERLFGYSDEEAVGGTRESSSRRKTRSGASPKRRCVGPAKRGGRRTSVGT
jgi:PAS domain S-box-containing protein